MFDNEAANGLNGRANTQRLLSVLLSYASNGPAQQACIDMLHKAEDAGTSHIAIHQMLAQSIIDGLRDGNWPWAITQQNDRRD